MAEIDNPDKAACMTEREQTTASPAVPASIKALVEGRAWARDLIGESGGAVYRLHAPGEPDLYLKQGIGAVAGDISDEMVRLRWLGERLPVPAVQHFESGADGAWLLMTALPGRTAYQRLVESPGDLAIVDALALFLRRTHAIPVETCPFNSDHRLRLGLARARIDAGLVDVEDFDDCHAGWTAEQVWDEVTKLLPLTPDPVVTHGDYSLDNILLEGGAVTGCIDVGRAGIAERYQDVAILWNCLGEFGAAHQQRFLTTYGIELDEAKLRFHLGLDEFF